MSTEQNKQIVLRWREEIWTKRNLNIIDELHAPDYVGHIAGIPGPIRGREALKQFLAGYLAAFDGQATPEFLVAEGDLVVVRDTNRVTFTRAFRGIPPTGKEVRVPSTDIYRIVDGRIVEQWTELDYTGMMHQLGLLPAQGHGAPASTEANRTLARRFCEEVLTEQRLDRADELVAPDYVDHGAVPGQGPGLAGAKRKWAMVFAALPDLRVPIQDLVAEGDRVAVRWTAEGTHRGELLGVPPTGKRIRFTGMSICRFEDGRLVEQWEEADRLGLAHQLGASPAPAGLVPGVPAPGEAAGASGAGRRGRSGR